MKAFIGPDNEIRLFRPFENLNRHSKSNERLCMPAIDKEMAFHGLTELLKLDKHWIPSGEGTALYIRPFVIAIDPFIGVKASESYQYIIILSPVGSYYPNGLAPTSIYVESEHARAVKGGSGTAKAGGNYAASLLPLVKAKEKGYDQVLFLDAVEKKYVEEIGTSNAFFIIDDTVITPKLSGSILDGITRKSVIQLLKDKGYKVDERLVSMQEVFEASKQGKLKEVFATGTAAVISPVGKLLWDEEVISVNDNKIGKVSQMLYDTIVGIQRGTVEDKYGWVEIVNE
jgi:branched-chain amino acid aminotransferase